MNVYSITVASLVFLFGASIGSFLNVLIYRLGSGARMTGRSKCLSCGKTLTALMLVPIVSYIFQGGRCRYCKSRVSSQYAFVEVVTGILFVIVALKHHLFLLGATSLDMIFAVIDAVVWSLLVVVFVYDWKHKIIPDQFSLLFATLGALLLFLKSHYGIAQVPYLPFLSTTPQYLDWFAAPIVAVPLGLVWLLTGGRGMGLGDAKLAWGIGWFLGFSGGVTAIILSFWIAFFPSLGLLFLKKKKFTMRSEIPFAPFLILGMFFVYAFGIDILSWTL